MFDPNKIYTDYTGRFLCEYDCDSESTAKILVPSYLMSVHEYYFPAELYNRGSKLILATPDREKTKELANLLNESIKKNQ